MIYQMLRVFDGGVPDRVLGRGSAISLFRVYTHSLQFLKYKKYFSELVVDFFRSDNVVFLSTFCKVWSIYLYIHNTSFSSFFSLSTLTLQREIYKEKVSLSQTIKKPRRKPRLFSCFLKLIYKVCYFSHVYVVITLIYYSVNPLTCRVFKLPYSYIIVDIAFILVLHLFCNVALFPFVIWDCKKRPYKL